MKITDFFFCESKKLNGRYIKVQYCGRDVGEITEYGNTRTRFMARIKHGDSLIARSIPEAKKLFAENFNPETFCSKAKPMYLTAGEATNFFPTPPKLAGRMIAKVRWEDVSTVLEPSAGKGDLVDVVKTMFEQQRYHKRYHRSQFIPSWKCEELPTEIDCIESDQNLRFILQGKNLRVVADDFLAFTTFKWYDLIIMNPPFDKGDRHLMKAIAMQESNGGQIVCLLNAETIRNPYTNLRKALLEKLRRHEAEVEYVKDSFKHAERITGVDVAIVYIDIKKRRKQSAIFARLEAAEAKEKFDSAFHDLTEIVPENWMEQMVACYQKEAKLGVTLMEEYANFQPYMTQDSEKTENDHLIRLEVCGKTYSQISSETFLVYLKKLRAKYWQNLFGREEITSLMTSKIQSEYLSQVKAMSEYDFSLFNIKRVMAELNLQLRQGVEDSIMDLFDTLSAKHSWYPECSNNIHYYNGWSTNKAHKVGMKAIIPFYNAYSRWSNTLNEHDVAAMIRDLERALNYLDNGTTIFKANVAQSVRAAAAERRKKINFTWFSATFYKKGTCHLRFFEEARPLIDRLNIFASQKRGWLPPCYGKVRYTEMDEASKAVVDSFQGQEAYENILANKDFYLLPVGLPALTE